MNLATPTKTHVLLIEQDDVVRNQLARQLKAAEYETVSVATLSEALERFYSGFIDAALVDLRLTAGEGWDVIDQMIAINPCLPIVALCSPDAKPASMARATAALERPIAPKLLVETVTRLVAPLTEARRRRSGSTGPILVTADAQAWQRQALLNHR